MKIRRAAEHELLELWGYESIDTASSNAKFFCDNIKRGNTEFWTLDDDGELVGELYVFYDLEHCRQLKAAVVKLPNITAK